MVLETSLPLAGIQSEWPWWDDLHTFWRQLPNYDALGVQSLEPGTRHASEAEALFAPSPALDSDEAIGGEVDGYEAIQSGSESRGGLDSEDDEPEEGSGITVDSFR
jgi:hypothetical protein